MYFDFLHENVRSKWTVEVEAHHLLKAAAARVEYHKGRVEWWSAQRADAEAKLREGGITIKHFDNSSGVRAEAVLDQTLSRRITECERKVESHRQLEKRYRAFVSFFGLSSPAAKFKLNADDVLYFNLKAADDGEEE